MASKNDDGLSITAHTMINGWVRAVLAAVGGWLVTRGVLDMATASSLQAVLVPAVAGVVTIVATGLWSTAEKRLTKMLPPTSPLPEGVNPPAG